jgi:excisionase family DNA binding protein
MKAMAVDGEVLTAKEVCALLRIHVSTLYKLTKQGRIPSFRIGNDWRFRMELIERWMAEKSVFARLARNFIESGVNCSTSLPNGDKAGEHFCTAALSTLPLETAAGASNRS